MDKKQQDRDRRSNRKNHLNLSQSNTQFSGPDFNEDGQDEFYDMGGGYAGGNTSG